MRFVDMEGDAAVFADPHEISERYREVVTAYLNSLKSVVLESSVDYHRITIDQDYEQALFRLLARRTKSRGVR